MAQPGAMAGDGGDPRLNSMANLDADYVLPQMRKFHDPSVTFEEYHYYAQQTRAEELAAKNNDQTGSKGLLATLFPSKSDNGVQTVQSIGPPREKKESVSPDLTARPTVSNEEWTNASRALRIATWPAIFYLITTDILGPYNLP